MPVCEKGWPQFASVAELTASPWGAYFKDVYGALPTAAAFPLDTSAWWMLYDSLLTKHAVPLPKSAGKCAPANCQLNLFGENNAYSPPSQWIWHPPPYAAFSDNQWVEVLHEQDPFGDEHFGAWYLHAKGSGVWYNIGKSVTFPDHAEAYAHFNTFNNEAMCRAAAAAGFDTIQFTAHPDHVNYPCDTAGHYPYMNIEIVAVKLQGTYACGSNVKPDFNVLRSGWADQPCACDNTIRFSNCGRALLQLEKEGAVFPHSNGSQCNNELLQVDCSRQPGERAPSLAEPLKVADATDCSMNHTHAIDPPWFASCNKTACLRIWVESNSPNAINIGNSTDEEFTTLGFRWCIDHTNAVVYAMMEEPSQPSSPPFYKAYFELDDAVHRGHGCRFLASHWTSGNLVHIYQQDRLNCSIAYVPSQLPGLDGVTNATLHVTVAP